MNLNEKTDLNSPQRSERPGSPRASSPRTLPVGWFAAAVTLVFAVLVAFAGDLYFRHGLEADYYYRQGDSRVLIASQDEHRTAFATEHFPLSRYVQNWPSFSTLPPPVGLPPIDIEFHARIELGPGDPSYLGLDASGTATIEVDGQPIDSTASSVRTVGPLEAGTHRVEIEWKDRPTQRSHFAILWGRGPDNLEPLPRSRVLPADTSWPAARRWFWATWFVLTALFVGLASWVARANVTPLRMKRWDWALGIAILVLGAGLRVPDYDVMPEFRENGDELFALWNGFSLLEDGTPRGWSLWSGQYVGVAEIEPLRQFGLQQAVVTPYFEHPPLLHLLVGLATHSAGTEDWRESRLSDGRPVVVLLSLVTLAFVILIARQLYPVGPTPWLAGLIYACLPFVVLQARVIKEESLMVPLEMAAIYFFLRWRNGTRNSAWLWAAAVACGLCPFTKVPGVAFILALVMLVLAENDVRRAITVGAIGFALTLLWPIFGLMVDWDVFVLAQASQSGRPSHFNVFARWFDDPLVNHNLIGRGWLIFLWLASMVTLNGRARKDTAALIVPLVMYMLAISVGSGNWTFGWYAAPFYPILCIGAGAYIAELWERPNLLGGILFVTLFVFYGANFVFDHDWSRTAPAWAVLRRWMSVVLVVMVGPFCASQVWPARWSLGMTRAAIALGMLSYIGLSMHFVYSYDVLYNVYRNYDRDAFYDR